MRQKKLIGTIAALIIPIQAHPVPSESETRAIIERASYQRGLGIILDIPAFINLSESKKAQYSAQISEPLNEFRYINALSRVFRSGSGKIPGIDRVVLINLDRRPEKLKQSLAGLEPYEIVPEVLSAVDGKKVNSQIAMELGVQFEPGMPRFMSTRYLSSGKSVHAMIGPADSTWLCHHFSRMQMGCYLSHLSILWDSYQKGLDRVWVLEDDIEVIRDPRAIADAIFDLEKIVGVNEWDILYTDLDHKNNKGETIKASGYSLRPNLIIENDVFNREDIGNEFIRYGSRYGTHSYIISREGIKKVLAFAQIFGIYAPIDIDLAAIPGIRQYGIKNSIIETNSCVHD